MSERRLNWKGDLRNHQFPSVGPPYADAVYDPYMTEYDETADRTTVHYQERGTND